MSVLFYFNRFLAYFFFSSCFFLFNVFLFAITLQCFVSNMYKNDILISLPFLQIKRLWSYEELESELQILFLRYQPRWNLTKSNFDSLLEEVWNDTRSMSQLREGFKKLLEQQPPFYKRLLKGQFANTLIMLLTQTGISFAVFVIKHYFFDAPALSAIKNSIGPLMNYSTELVPVVKSLKSDLIRCDNEILALRKTIGYSDSEIASNTANLAKLWDETFEVKEDIRGFGRVITRLWENNGWSEREFAEFFQVDDSSVTDSVEKKGKQKSDQGDNVWFSLDTLDLDSSSENSSASDDEVLERKECDDGGFSAVKTLEALRKSRIQYYEKKD